MKGYERFKIDWASVIAGRKFTIFMLFYFVFESNFQVQAPVEAYIWRGDLIEGFLLYEGLIHGLLSPQTSFGFVCHAFISLSLGRNECVTNKPQRTSAGRLIHGGAYFWNFMVFVICNNYIPVALFSNVTAFRIALIQLAVSSNKSQNLLRAKEKIKEAVFNGAKVVALPVRILFDNFKLICLHSEACYPYNLTVQARSQD